MAAEIREKITRQVLNGIQQGAWKVGDRLPTEIELATKYGTSRSNVHLAMKELEQHGIIRRQRRRGTFVAKGPGDELKAILGRFTQQSTRHVHVVVSARQPPKFHWDESALRQLEQTLNDAGMVLVHETAPPELSAEFLADLVSRLQRTGSYALALLADITNHWEPPPELIDPSLVAPLLRYPGDIVLLNRSGHTLCGWPFHAVNLDPYGEGMLAARALLNGAFDHILVARYRTQPDWMSLRSKGFDVVARVAFDTRARVEHPVIDTDPMQAGAQADLIDRLQRLEGRTAIVAPNDEVADAILKAGATAELSCPDDYELLSFDDNPAYRHCNLTTIAPPTEMLGQVVGRMICERLHGEVPGSRLAVTIPSRIVERLTCRLDLAASDASPLIPAVN